VLEEELGEEIELAQVAINVERKVTLVAIVLKEAKVVEVEVALEHAINVVKKAILVETVLKLAKILEVAIEGEIDLHKVDLELVTSVARKVIFLEIVLKLVDQAIEVVAEEEVEALVLAINVEKRVTLPEIVPKKEVTTIVEVAEAEVAIKEVEISNQTTIKMVIHIKEVTTIPEAGLVAPGVKAKTQEVDGITTMMVVPGNDYLFNKKYPVQSCLPN